MAEIHDLLDQARPQPRQPNMWRGPLSASANVLMAVAILLLSFVVWRVWEENHSLRTEQRCRAELAADDSRALGRVILVFAQGAINPTPASRQRTLAELAVASVDLQRTQQRRAHADEICAGH